MSFHQPYFLSLLTNFKTFRSSCHARKCEPLIKYVILIISHMHLWYSKKSAQNDCRKALNQNVTDNFNLGRWIWNFWRMRVPWKMLFRKSFVRKFVWIIFSLNLKIFSFFFTYPLRFFLVMFFPKNYHYDL